MNRATIVCGGLGLMALLLLAAVQDEGRAQVTKGKTRAALTKQLMKGVIQPNCAAVGAALKEKPADDKAWEALAVNAALLNEMGFALMDDGRCPDADWAGASKTLRECSAVLLDKVGAKDFEGAGTAFGELTKSCAACHKAHKKAK